MTGKTEIVTKLPGSLDGISFRRGTQDWAVTFAIQKEDYLYAKPLGEKLNMFFVVALFPVESREQGLCILAERIEVPEVETEGPKTQIVTTAELQEMFAENRVPMTRQHIAVLERSGFLHKISRGKYDRNSSINGYVEYLRRQAQGKGDQNYQEARAAEKHTNALLKQLQWQKETGACVNAEEMTRTLTAVFAAIPSIIDNAGPKIMAKLLPYINPEHIGDVEGILAQQYDDVRTECQSMDVASILDRARFKGSVQAKTKAKSKSVGRKVRVSKRRK